jgi:hypothetical protein
MNTTGLLKRPGPLVALAMCSACGGGSPVAPSSAALDGAYVGKTLSVNGVPVTAERLVARPRYATSVPDGSTNSENFEYIINYYGTYASIFDYPKSDKQVGTINNVGGQGCTNVLYGYGKKIVWIVAGADQITEYEVPKTPLKTLSVSVGAPSSCAMDTSGDLAVGILDGSGGGDVVIFPHASGSGNVMTTPLDKEYFDGYDPQGNLFFDGFNRSDAFELVELPKYGVSFQPITTSNRVEFPGSVQWDGTYLDVTDQRADAIYQYTVSGTKATLEGTVHLTGASDCAQTWIATGIVYCADAGNGDGEVFDYPSGGSPVAVFTGNFDLPLGVTAAEK